MSWSPRRSIPIVVLAVFVAILGCSSPRAEAPPPVAGTSIHGTVVDSSLSPVSGVAVTLERAGRVVARAVSDAQGEFSFIDIAPGTYQVKAERPGFPAIARAMTVPAGASDLRLPLVLAAPETAPAAGAPKDASAARVAQPTTVAPQPPLPPPPAASPVTRPMETLQMTAGGAGRGGGGAGFVATPAASWPVYAPQRDESYTHFEPNRFHQTADQPLSTFGADVDTASYTNVRRFLSSGQLPPSDAVRIEELVNYFRMDYAAPADGRPIALTTEVGECPWAPAHKLVLIGARAAASVPRETEGRSIVLLIDVSGSMAPAPRLPLLKTAFGMFVDTLRADDRVSIVTYAGTSGVALPPTPVRDREVIQRAIAGLSAGGSTNGGQGLITAYRIARQAFVPGGVNRVILATDGDFNVGVVDGQDLLRLITREKESGVFLSVLGVGTDNLKDSTMQMLADHGNGHYAYLDSLQEARRVLVREGDATLETVAKDVKFQVEFNPAVIGAWKLLGYEKRALAAEDFNNDRRDAGEMGAGHTVTVLYEVVPVGVRADTGDVPSVDPLKYQPVARPTPVPPSAHQDEWMTVKARYQLPEARESQLITRVVRAGGPERALPFVSAVAEFGMLLRDAPYDQTRWDALARRLSVATSHAPRTADADAFAELVSIAKGLSRLSR
jgi:Ca-activated chloride channel family protein